MVVRREAGKTVRVLDFKQALKNVPLFAGCTKKELERIARSGDEIKMTAGTLLVDQGQTGREAFVILDGEVSVKRNGRKVATLGPGGIVGDLSLLDHGPRTATAICDTATLPGILARTLAGVPFTITGEVHLCDSLGTILAGTLLYTSSAILSKTLPSVLGTTLLTEWLKTRPFV